MDQLLKALPNALAELPGVGRDHDVPAPAPLKVAQRHALKKQRIEGVGEEKRVRKFALPAELACADHAWPRLKAGRDRSRIRLPVAVSPSSPIRRSWRSQLIATQSRESVRPGLKPLFRAQGSLSAIRTETSLPCGCA